MTAESEMPTGLESPCQKVGCYHNDYVSCLQVGEVIFPLRLHMPEYYLSITIQIKSRDPFSMHNRQTILLTWAKVLPCDIFDFSVLRSVCLLFINLSWRTMLLKHLTCTLAFYSEKSDAITLCTILNSFISIYIDAALAKLLVALFH